MKTHWAVIGGVRFFLAVIVLFGHIAHFCVLPRWAENISHLDPFSAVLSFFLISGFSIAASLDREPGDLKNNLKNSLNYYERRVSRIYPVYLACYLLAAVPFLVWGQAVDTNGYGLMQAPHSIWDFVGGAFLLQGLLTHLVVTLGPSWTLGLEAQLYALAPLLKRLRTGMLLGLAAASLLAFVNYSRLTHVDLTDMRWGEGTAFLAWAWILGFVFYRHRDALWAKALLTGAALLGACVHVGGIGNFGPLTVGITVFALLHGKQMDHGGQMENGREVETRFTRPLSYLGDVSYPLYMVHWPVMVLLAGGDAERPFWLYLAAPLLSALLVLHFVDWPYRAYARRVASRRVARPVSDAGPAADVLTGADAFYDTPKSVSSRPAPVPVSLPE